ncbi:MULTISPECIES: DNA ligase [unclassified Clostridium]|uniref:DNA ligase n=1 Tax=unclassified Clostridium TaxID=2614128 RepID=UPI001FA945F5|nr:MULTISPECIES: DNA ligase [unclassified Clostridium]
MTEYQSRQMEKMLKFPRDVDLLQEEIRTLIWLAGWEESTVDALLSVMDKVAKAREYKGLK